MCPLLCPPPTPVTPPGRGIGALVQALLLLRCVLALTEPLAEALEVRGGGLGGVRGGGSSGNSGSSGGSSGSSGSRVRRVGRGLKGWGLGSAEVCIRPMRHLPST